jgi:hypothetical protein
MWRDGTLRIISKEGERCGREAVPCAIRLKQIKARIARGEDRTNWEKIDDLTGGKLEASIRADADDLRREPDWTKAITGLPPKTISISALTTTSCNGSGQTAGATRPL